MAKKEKEEKRELVVQESGVPAVMLTDMEDDAGAGFENISANDLAIPFIVILQSGSPQLKRGEQKIEGASEGDIFNTVTGEFWNGSEGIYVVPCTYKKSYVEWTPREQGGGFVKQHDSEEILANATKNDQGRDVLPNGNVIVPTAYHYILVVDPTSGDYHESVLSMTSTQLKKSRKWNSIMAGLKMTRKDGTKFTPPMFSHMYRLTTDPESNELGAWSGWKVELYSQVATIDIYNAAKKFAADINKGIIKEATPPQLNSEVEAF
jgi:hypothetical protein